MNKSYFTLITLMFFTGNLSLAQTPGRPLSVGIVLYPGVEVLDFSGPSEVFGATAGFRAFTVAYKKEPIISQGFVEVIPQYSIEDCPPTDILVFPGGGTGNVINEEAFIRWVKERSGTTQFMMSVCTGAGILSKAGLLDNLVVTTFHGFIEGLQEMTPTAEVRSDTRFVDNGHVITTAGVSAGIDGALHLVSRIRGEQTARATAFYMEYDKWQPNMGLVNESSFITRVRESGIAEAKGYVRSDGNALQPLFYDGEMLNLANELLERNPEESLAIFRWLSEVSGSKVAVYEGLAKALQVTGRPVPEVDTGTFTRGIENGEMDQVKATYAAAMKSFPGWVFFTDEQLIHAAYRAFASGKQDAAVAAFEWIVELYPNSVNGWDSLSEAYEQTGDASASVQSARKCLTLLDDSGLTESRKDFFKKIENERIDRLTNPAK